MTTDNQLFDAAFPMKIGDREFQASMLTDRDFGDLSEYIQAKYIALAYNAGKLLSPEEKRELVSIALNAVINIGWGTDEGVKVIMKDDGYIRLGFQLCRKRHPTLTLKEFDYEAKKNILETIDQIHIAYTKLHPVPKEDTGGSSTGNDKSD